MIIDRTHRPWVTATLIMFTMATVAYVVFALRSSSRPRGGTAAGLILGIMGYALMLYAGFLGARKKVPTWRIGRTQTWMRGHLWLGLLSFPLILFHAGFGFRGPLTAVLMVLFFIVVLSGIAGAALQHYLPRFITTRIPMETIYEEIPHVRAQLRTEADQLAESVESIELDHEAKLRFREAYVTAIRPQLDRPRMEVFQPLRVAMPEPLHGVLDDLASICEEQLQLNRQEHWYRWLHGWLLVHVPASIAVLVLGGIHAFMALRY